MIVTEMILSKLLCIKYLAQISAFNLTQISASNLTQIWQNNLAFLQLAVLAQNVFTIRKLMLLGSL